MKNEKFRLIAEVGLNHLGSLKLAMQMIDAGASVGVELFKFQMYHIEEFGEDPSWKWYDYVKHCAFTKDQYVRLQEFCVSRNVTFFASVFGDWSLELAKEIDMPIIKIASRSVYDKHGKVSPLAQKIAATGKPVIASLGWRKYDWPTPKWSNGENVYCVSKYPTTRADISWPEFGDQITGFSDHSIGTELAKEAIDLGATIIEKHFTTDKTLFGPDQSGSSLPHEMKEIQEYGDSKIRHSTA
jgi:N,N'-diacetyllegionaminate synthase